MAGYPLVSPIGYQFDLSFSYLMVTFFGFNLQELLLLNPSFFYLIDGWDGLDGMGFHLDFTSFAEKLINNLSYLFSVICFDFFS